MRVVDLRSDTVTRPTVEMRRAMAEAEVGDDVLDHDPTVARLEERVAGLLGQERALFFPSGIMANQTAVMVLAEPGTEAVIEANGHILAYEEAAAAAWAGVQLRAVPSSGGLLSADLVAAHIRPESPYLPRTSLVCLENTHNHGGGAVLPPAELSRIVEMARERGIAVHLDGARLWNSAAATGEELSAWSEPVDTVMVSLSKGLGAPVGSVLAGSDRAMDRAWRIRRRLGGGMRQSGILAAAGLHALDHHLDALSEDHRRARELAAAADAIDGLAAVVPATNIVMIDVSPQIAPAMRLMEALEARGVRTVPFGPGRLRAVTHRDVDDAGIRRAAEALEDIMDHPFPKTRGA